LKIYPSPTEEEAAAIMAALQMLSEDLQQDTSSLKRSRWRLAGLLGHAVESGLELDTSLWAYSRWEG
jgi:predicted DNA-binding transcriptional regulator YafY